MVLQKLFQELNRLLPGDIRAKVAVAAEQLVKPIHSSRGGEAGGIVPKVLAVFPDGHTSPKQTSHLIPLKENRPTHVTVQFNLMFRQFVLSDDPDTTGEQGMEWCSLAKGLWVFVYDALFYNKVLHNTNNRENNVVP